MSYSIIIPTLNEEYFLPNLLSDLEKQTEKDFEVIIVDASVNDKTEKSALQFKNRLDLQYFRTNRGVAYQRNFGAAYASGSYILFIDADSRINRHFLSDCKKILLSKKHKIIMPYLIPDRDWLHINLIFTAYKLLVKFSQVFSKPFATGGSFFIERKLFKKIGGFDEHLFLGEDHDFIKKAYKKGIHPKLFDNLEIIMSLRRMDREGQLTLAYKWATAAVYTGINKQVTDKLFDYQMGGVEYWKTVDKYNFRYGRNFVLAGVVSMITLAFVSFFVQYSATTHPTLSKNVLASAVSDYADTVKLSPTYKKYEKILITKVIEPIKTSVSIGDFLKKESSNLTTGFIAA